MDSTGAQKIYASVKSYSQRGGLLPKSVIQTLTEPRDLDELVSRIKNTEYADGVSKITKPYTAEKIESALRSHLADIHFSCYDFRPARSWYFSWNLLFYWEFNHWCNTRVLYAFCYIGFFRQNLKMAFENYFIIHNMPIGIEILC
ncbi:MAG: V-type ATPase subunit [Nitrosopumilaceae archaeon]|nr:V-type ATPase subunit [Nitrosopumilaceae archaeon]